MSTTILCNWRNACSCFAICLAVSLCLIAVGWVIRMTIVQWFFCGRLLDTAAMSVELSRGLTARDHNFPRSLPPALSGVRSRQERASVASATFERKSSPDCAYDLAFLKATGELPFRKPGGERGRSKAQTAEIGGGGEARSANACCICLTEAPTHALQPCGHYCLCATCVSPFENGGKCPLCRGDVQRAMRIF